MKVPKHQKLWDYGSRINKDVEINAEDIRDAAANMDPETRGIWLHALLVELRDFATDAVLIEIGNQLTPESLEVLSAIVQEQVGRR